MFFSTGEAARSAQESQSTVFPDRGRQADEDSSEEDESSDEEGDGPKSPVYHFQIWKKLLKMGSQGGILRYGLFFKSPSKIQADHITVNGQPEAGINPMDVTAVMESQITWDMNDRRFWPRNLTLWGHPVPWLKSPVEPPYLKYKGHVVLDFDGKEIRDLPIPLTISSKVEGLRMEAWQRSDDRITFQDIAARIWTKDVPGAGTTGKLPMFDRRALSKRASNARIRAGLISWKPRQGREAQTNFMDSLRTPAQRASNLATNKDLTSKQNGEYAKLGLNMDKDSTAKTRGTRIRKIMNKAGQDDTIGVSSLGATIAGLADPVGTISGDDDDLSNDTDDEDVNEETYISDQAAGNGSDDDGNVSSSIVDSSDSRHDLPMNPREEALLQRALANTVEEFVFLTGQQPQETNMGDNYFSQWGVLQEEYRSLWAARGNPGEAPRLKARDRWTGGISRYYDAEVIEGVAYDEGKDA